MKTTKTIFILIVPWDYTTAEVEVFDSREEAERYRDGEVSESARHYATIREVEI